MFLKKGRLDINATFDTKLIKIKRSIRKSKKSRIYAEKAYLHFSE